MTDFSVRKLPVLSIPYAIPAMVYHISLIAIRVGKNGKLLEGRYLGLSFCSYEVCSHCLHRQQYINPTFRHLGFRRLHR